MLAYLDNQELFWLTGVIILVGGGIWFFRKHWAVASVVGAVVLLGATVMIPNIDFGHDQANQANCINNLRQIDEAKTRWAAEHHKEKKDMPTDSELFGQGSFLQSKPKCLSGGIYTIGSMDENPKCSLGDTKGHRLD